MPSLNKCLKLSLQQYLPFTVLKRIVERWLSILRNYCVATVLTVYGIETRQLYIGRNCFDQKLQQYLPFTVLKLYDQFRDMEDFDLPLQQYLPFTVLKRTNKSSLFFRINFQLQQYLPFTVLKL